MNSKKTIALLSVAVVSLSFAGTSHAFAANEQASYKSEGTIEFIPNTSPIDPVDPTKPDPNKPVQPVDPTKPDGKPNPGTNGPLSIDYASSLNFGLNKISNKDEVYYAQAQTYTDQPATANYVQVTDNRGTNSGWTLTVKQVGQFTAEKQTVNSVLTGAQLTFTDAVINSNSDSLVRPNAENKIVLQPTGVETVVMTAKQNSGAGTWIDYWGKVEKGQSINQAGVSEEVSINKAISLSIPGATPKDATKYQTSLVWSLSDVPK